MGEMWNDEGRSSNFGETIMTLTPRERELARHARNPWSQHDDHCWVVFDGVQRWIVCAHGNVLATTSEVGPAIVDLRSVDWEAYNFVALEMLRAAFPDCSLTYANSLGALAALEPGEELDSEDFPG
jgi:hypothetical protein